MNSAIRHQLLLSDLMNNQLHYVDEIRPEKSWSMASGGLLQDLQLAGDGAFLHTHDHGWSYRRLADGGLLRTVAADADGIASLRLLPGGGTMAGCNTPAGIEIRQFDPVGRTIRRWPFHDYQDLRMLRRTPHDTWLLAHHDGALEAALGKTGEIRRRFTAPNIRYAYQALMTPLGSYLLSGGYSCTVTELTPDNRILRTLVAPQPAGQGSYFYSGFQQLPNGHLVQANWSGHDCHDYREGLKLFEFDPDGNVVWSWTAPKEKVGSVTAILVLDGLNPDLAYDDAHGVLAPFST